MRQTVTILVILIFSAAALSATNLSRVRQELKGVKTELRSAEGSKKVKLMKKMAKLENQIVEESGADRNKSKPRR